MVDVYVLRISVRFNNNSAQAVRYGGIRRELQRGYDVRSVVGAALLPCLGVVVLGACMRLSDAGLGCPDWPGCYGHLTPLVAAALLLMATVVLSRRLRASA